MMLSDGEEHHVNKIYKAYRTLHQMLKDRGYLITDDKLNITKDQLKSQIIAERDPDARDMSS